MKFTYQFANLLGTVYKSGDIVFTNDGNTIVCPVGNKLSIYDLRNNRSRTLPIETRYNFCALALSPNGQILIASSYRGMVHVINMRYQKVMYTKKFPQTVYNIKFSPDGKHFAISKGNEVLVYCAPGADKRIFNPFVLERVYDVAFDIIQSIDWSYDSRLLLIGSRDMTTRVCLFAKVSNYSNAHIAGNNDAVIGAYFDDKTYDVCTVGRDGRVTMWRCKQKEHHLKIEEDLYKGLKQTEKAEKEEEEEEDDIDETPQNKNQQKGKKDQKKLLHYSRGNPFNATQHLTKKHAKVRSTAFHKSSKMLVVTFTTGDFLLLDMNDGGALVHSLNISDESIESVALNPNGDWIALGVSSRGQLLVWEWQSETYVLKQQSHFNNMRVVCYSPDGQNLATGGEDGKIKLWSTQSSFSYVTFSEHTAPVTGVAFTQSGRAIISSSLDGTVRAFDLIRYRNFKTLTSPRPTQFSCVSVDSSGELIAAGGQDNHDIYLWSLKLGKLLEVLAGHKGPVASVDFSKQPGSTMMSSTAWDGTVKVWDAIADTSAKENIMLPTDGLCVTFRPDGKQVAVATMDGQITLFNPTTGRQEGNIVGQDDIGAGRSEKDKVTAETNTKSKAFTTLCYSADGKYIIAGGQSKNVCIYSIEEELLIKKFEITQNRSFDAMDDTVNSRKMAENGINRTEIEVRKNFDKGIKLAGLRRGDMSQREFRPEIRVTCLTFSPTGRSWVACTSEGLLVYSLDTDFLFDPFLLDMGNTPSAVKHKLKEEDYATALMMALKLNIANLKQEVLEKIPLNCVTLVVSDLTQLYVESLLQFIAESLEATPHIGLYSYWATTLVTCHGQALKNRAPQITSTLNALQKSLSVHQTNLSKVCTHNEYMLSYLLAQATLRRKRALPDIAAEKMDDSGIESPPMEDDVEPSNDRLEDMFAEEVEP